MLLLAALATYDALCCCLLLLQIREQVKQVEFVKDSNEGTSQTELPPRALLERLARELPCRLGLYLFNLDMIRGHGTRDRFYVIGINYFPGYGKMPEYENIFTDFLLSLV